MKQDEEALSSTDGSNGVACSRHEGTRATETEEQALKIGVAIAGKGERNTPNPPHRSIDLWTFVF